MFYHQIRPFLGGWKGSDVLPEGMFYEGVWLDRKECSGGSAAQSSIIAAIDVALGVKHEPETPGGDEFLKRMRGYMPKFHRNLLEALGVMPGGCSFDSVRNAAQTCGHAAALDAYNVCVANLKTFRSAHIAIVTQYIVLPARYVNKLDDILTTTQARQRAAGSCGERHWGVRPDTFSQACPL